MKKRKIVGVPNPPQHIRARECDVSMARAKGFLPCDHNCKECHACIEVLTGGERRHYNYNRGSGNL